MFKKIFFILFLTTIITFAGERSNQDADADHIILTPTTETMNKGEFTFNSYELFFAGLSYGATDDLQITFTTLLPITSDIPIVGLLTAKYKLTENKSSAFAIQPGILFTELYIGEDKPDEEKRDSLLKIFNLTLIYDFFLTPKATLTLSSSTSIPLSTDSDLSFLMTFTSALNVILRENLKFVAELTIMGNYNDGKFTMIDEVFFFNYGIKFFNEKLAATLSFLKPIIQDNSSDLLLLGFPYVAFTAKF